MENQLSPVLFDDLKPRDKRPRTHTIVVLGQNGRIYGRTLVRSWLTIEDELRPVIAREFPEADKVSCGIIYNTRKLVPGPVRLKWPSDHKYLSDPDADGFIWLQHSGKNAKRKCVNAYWQLLGFINALQQDGRIWADNYTTGMDSRGKNQHHLSFSL